MGHGVDDVVNPHAVSLRGITFRIAGMIRPFPGIAIVLVEADGDDYTPVVVVNSTPVRLFSVFFPDPAGIPVLDSRNLHAIAQIIQDVEDGILVIYFYYGAVGEHTVDAL